MPSAAAPSPPRKPRPAVFFDRDDTLILNRSITAHSPHPGSLFDPALVQLLPGAPAACADLKRAGFALVVVTNQGAVARGHCTIAQVQATNARLRELLRAADPHADLDAVYFCPHHPQGTLAPYNTEHPWRKPHPGMLLAAAHDLNLDLAQSWMIGDADRDIAAALNAGLPPAQTIILDDEPAPNAGHRVRSLSEAARIIVASTTST
jgi:D-glycero-D-manno-heptose 1,7-bisphosphate phosphatase